MNAGKTRTRTGRGSAGLAALALVLALAATAATAMDWSLATGLYADVKARQVGDILTIIIQESSEVSREASQQSGKSTTGGGNATFGYPTIERPEGETETGPWSRVNLPDYNWSLRHNFTGGGQVSSKEDFTSTMSARVLDVLPNGNLLLEGKRMVKLQKEMVEVTLTGMVRPKDVASDNTVSSARLADASIRYDTQGPITRDQQRGLATRFLNWINLF
jgi:flagellar L-ring protein FlgH